MSEQYPWRDEDRLREMYHSKGLSLSEIANEWDTGSTTIHSWMEKHGIETNTANKDKPAHFRTEERGYEVWRAEVGGEQHKVRVHRLAAVAEYGLDAVRNNEIHHYNEIPWDNRPRNIIPMEPQSHQRHHNS